MANAGPDQHGVVPTSTVTLDGTGSTFASTFNWVQTAPRGASGHRLKNATSANPTFVVPPLPHAPTFTFTLSIKDVNGTAATDTVRSPPTRVDLVSTVRRFKRGGAEWRVRGPAKYCSANNLVSVFWNKPDGAGGTPGPGRHAPRRRWRSESAASTSG